MATVAPRPASYVPVPEYVLTPQYSKKARCDPCRRTTAANLLAAAVHVLALGTVEAHSLNAPRSCSWSAVQAGSIATVGDGDGRADGDVLGCTVGGGMRPIPPVTTTSATPSATTKADSKRSALERLMR